MAQAKARRTMYQQSILNMAELVENDGYLALGIPSLQSNLRHLKRNFNFFRAAHARVTSQLGAEEMEQETILLARIENCYISTLNKIHERIDGLTNALQNARALAMEQASLQFENEDLNSNASGNGVPEQSNSLGSIDETEQQLPQPSAPQFQRQLQQQLQPIVVQLQGMGKVENTWGEFDGHLSKWKSFYDRFRVAVHENDAIARVFKFQHLCNSLKGYAATSINNWEQTEDNYEEAWKRLKELYNRPYETVNELFDKFEGLAKLDKPTGGMLQKMSNVTHEVVRQLRALGVSVDHYDPYFVNGIRRKLDSETCKQWELLRNSLPNAQKPKLSDVLSFVENQARAIFAVNGIASKDNRKRSTSDKEQNNGKKFKPNDSVHTKIEQKSEYKPPQCVMCSENHHLYKCSAFLKLKLAERKKIVNEKKLCRNCLNASHFEKDCKKDACFRCKVKHNSLLCNENPKNQGLLVNATTTIRNSNYKGKSNNKSEKEQEKKTEKKD